MEGRHRVPAGSAVVPSRLMEREGLPPELVHGCSPQLHRQGVEGAFEIAVIIPCDGAQHPAENPRERAEDGGPGHMVLARVLRDEERHGLDQPRRVPSIVGDELRRGLLHAPCMIAGS